MAASQDDDEDVLCEIAMAAAVVAEFINTKKQKHRTMFQWRSKLGAYNMLMAELRESDTGILHEHDGTN